MEVVGDKGAAGRARAGAPTVLACVSSGLRDCEFHLILFSLLPHLALMKLELDKVHENTLQRT